MYVGLVTCAAIFIGGAVVGCGTSAPQQRAKSTQPVRYLGVYEPDAPDSYTGVDKFAQDVTRQPNLVSYYSPWFEPFKVGFAT